MAGRGQEAGQSGQPVTIDVDRLRCWSMTRPRATLLGLAIAVGGGLLIFAPLGVAVWQWENVGDFVRQAIALEQPEATTARSIDPRPPTLFLRSFLDDSMELPSLQALRGLGHRKVVRFEEAFASLFGEVGPMIAIGEPDETLPTIGAAKAYFSNDEWQSAVLAWMEEARLIALAVGPTPAVTWELRNVLARGKVPQLILILPPARRIPVWKRSMRRAAQADRATRIRLLLACFEGTPWAHALQATDWSRTIVAHLDAGGNFASITARRPVDVDYQIALVLAFYGMLCAGNDEMSDIGSAGTLETQRGLGKRKIPAMPKILKRPPGGFLSWQGVVAGPRKNHASALRKPRTSRLTS